MPPIDRVRLEMRETVKKMFPRRATSEFENTLASRRDTTHERGAWVNPAAGELFTVLRQLKVRISESRRIVRVWAAHPEFSDLIDEFVAERRTASELLSAAARFDTSDVNGRHEPT